jgi:hypothetical protein
MRAAVNAIALLSALIALPVARATAEGSGQDGADQWVPSLSVIGGVSVQEWEGALESEICRGCTFPDPASEPLRGSATGGDRDVTPFVGGNLELMTPEQPIPTSPRLFVGGEIAATFGFERKVALEGDPGTLAPPFPEVPGNESQAYSEDDALGQGSETLAQLDSPFYGVYAGIAFPFELFGRPVRVKPAFAWIRYGVKVQGLVVDAECRPLFGLGGGCNDQSFPPGFLREIRIQGSETGTFDGVGPGLDIEMDTGRFGPLGSSIFIGARAYYTLGDRAIEFGASESFPTDDGPNLPPSETRARWSFEAQPWMYRIGLGFRVQWLGSAD